MKSLTFIEIDVDYCALTYGTAPCTAALFVTADKKCFNTVATCQDRVNFDVSSVTLRFTLEGTGFTPADIDAEPCIVSIDHSPGKISLGGDLGERATLTVQLKDFRTDDTGPTGDKYYVDRSYDPFKQGTYFGKFRKRHKYIHGKAVRLIRGEVGQAIEDMSTRHFIAENFSGPSADGIFTIVAKDILKIADDDRSRVPTVTDGRLNADITDSATSLVLSPAGIGDVSYPTGGHVAIAGKEAVSFKRKASQDALTVLMLHCNGTDASTTFTDSSTAAHTVTVNGNAQVDTAQSKFGGASMLLDGTDDWVRLDGSSDFAFGTGDFTIDMWFRLTTLGSFRMLYDSRPSGSSGDYPTLFVNSSNQLSFSIGAGSVVLTAATSVAANTWTHVAVTRAAGVAYLFMDGALEDSNTSTTNFLNGASRPIIGTDGQTPTSSEFIGHIDEVEVSKGVARWTAAFSPTGIETSTTSGNTLEITRAQLGSAAIAHKQDDRVQLVKTFTAADPADILYELLVNGAGIDPIYIDLPAWKLETASYLNRLYSANIAEPTGVRKLCGELIEQAALAVWWDDVGQEIHLQVLRSIPTDATAFDEEVIVDGSMDIQEQPDKRISQVWTYYDLRNVCDPADREDNYKSIAVTIDATRETDYGSPAIKKILSRWIPNGARTTALRINDVQLARYKDPPRAISFSLFRDTPVALGGGYKVGSWALQDDEGLSELAEVQVTRLVVTDSEISVACEEVLFDIPVDDLNNRVIIIDTNQNNVNVQTLHDSIYPVITTVGAITLTVIVDEGVIVGSTNTTTPAMTIGTFTSGLPITIKGRGRIQGRGGNGGTPSDVGLINGSVGGTALYSRQAITLDLTSGDGEIWGGGGGGGAWRLNATPTSPGGGGGGGAGTQGGTGGPYIGGSGVNGGTGTGTAGGAGGGIGLALGGAGGDPGTAGTNSAYGPATYNGTGGAAGSAIDGASYCTIVGTGDRRGAEIN